MRGRRRKTAGLFGIIRLTNYEWEIAYINLEDLQLVLRLASGSRRLTPMHIFDTGEMEGWQVSDRIAVNVGAMSPMRAEDTTMLESTPPEVASPIPAAQYLRMSTEHQQYSIHNQAGVIRRYALQSGFEIVRSYADPGKSGLLLKHRKGLVQLLSDVVGGLQAYKVILVYDVSRWGRFQDIDEAAYYEFVCKRAGVRIHYCAEPFVNDTQMPSIVMKALKRVMAAEYSRELSEKTFLGEKRNSELGFRNGSPPGYGLRRQLCSSDGTPKQLLGIGERKNLLADRVRLVVGPPAEVRQVREIYRMIIHENKTLKDIANDLNRRQVKSAGKHWTVSTVHQILRNPKYMGCHVWGRTAKKLGSPKVQQPESSWTKVPLAFQPIVDEATFTAAREALRRIKTDAELLTSLRLLLKAEGRLDQRLINNSRTVSCVATYVYRFGSLRKAYELIGYRRTKNFMRKALNRRTKKLKQSVVDKLLMLFPDQMFLTPRTTARRPELQIREGPTMAVVVCRATTTPLGHRLWELPTSVDRRKLTLLCRCNPENDHIDDYHLVTNMEGRTSLREQDRMLAAGIRVKNLRALLRLVPNSKKSNQPETSVDMESGLA
jgi:DNA invertase Pin-like site-specific DNA recombinase